MGQGLVGGASQPERGRDLTLGRQLKKGTLQVLGLGGGSQGVSREKGHPVGTRESSSGQRIIIVLMGHSSSLALRAEQAVFRH